MQKREKAAWGICVVLAIFLIILIAATKQKQPVTLQETKAAETAATAATKAAKTAATAATKAAETAADSSVKAGIYSPNLNYEFLIGGTAWQFSAESHALMIQAFNEADAQIDLYKSFCDDPSNEDYTYITDDAGKKHMAYKGKKLAVISDIDDTLVDGADYTANIIGKNGDYNNAAFARFLMSDKLTALPGAVVFANKCADSGIDLFYLTNRSDQGYKIGQSDSQGSYDSVTAVKGEGTYRSKDGTLVGTTLYQIYGKSAYDITMETMRSLGFPIDEDHLIVNDPKATGNTKEAGRKAIEQGKDDFPNGQRKDGNATVKETSIPIEPHEIVLLLGDNIGDFTDDFSAAGLDAVSRTDLTEKYADRIGTKWIILPNAVYGNSMDYASKYGFSKLMEHYDYTME